MARVGGEAGRGFSQMNMTKEDRDKRVECGY